MTAAPDEAIVAALAEVLDNLATGLWMGPGWGRIVAAELLPVVHRIAEQRAAVSEVVPHRPGCGLKVLPNGRHRAVCVCDDETHQLRLAYIRRNGVR